LAELQFCLFSVGIYQKLLKSTFACVCKPSKVKVTYGVMVSFVLLLLRVS
jgi:hypothetical protein